MASASNGTTTNGSSKQRRNDDDDVPPNVIAKIWVGLYRGLPTIDFPFTNLHISVTLFGAAFLWTSRIVIYEILVNNYGWPRDHEAPHNAVGSIIAVLHSTTLLPGLFVALTTQPYRPSEHLSAAPQWWQDLVNALMQYCTGYMVYDSIASFFVLKGPSNFVTSDLLFLGHHFATSLYMTQTRVLKAGHISAMICMVLGELTNPFHNSYYVASNALQLDCCNGAKMQQFHDLMGIGFAFSYFSMRVIIAPFFFLHVTLDLLFSKAAKKYIPLLTRFFWIFMIWAVEVGSYDWIMECWSMIQEFGGISAPLDDGSSGTSVAGDSEL